ncbi:MAG: double-strand break repair helicase AddA [Candidatus Puniceispirillaceae bacterium]
MTSPLPAPHLHAIPAGVPFATTLAAGMVGLAGSAEDLARATVLVPSRRAALSLRAAFLEIRGDDATLLPRIEPIGDVEEDSAEILGFAADGAALPPAMDPLCRHLWLARLLQGFHMGGVAPTPPQTMQLADSLARLLDALCNVDSTPDQLASLLPERFSRHWQDILKLLTILIDRWPAILDEQGVLDPADRRNRLIRLRCEAWRQAAPDDLVIVAGSTGTFAATRELIACVAALPNGHVVLPGLDHGAVGHWQEIQDDAGHPQHQLSVLLDVLGAAPSEIAIWSAAEGVADAGRLRRDLMREAFKPAPLSADWRQLATTNPDLGRDALDGLSIVECGTRAEEAGLIAVAMREVLETPERTAALVTPDRQLAEAVIAALQRWRIDVDDSAGRPLNNCPVGGFLQNMVTMVAEAFAPVPTLAFLKHPLVAGGLAPASFRARLRELELMALRGYRPAEGIAGILDRLAGNDDLLAFFELHIAAPLTPLTDAWSAPAPDLASLARAVGSAAEALAARRCGDDGAIDLADGAYHVWANEDGEAAARLLVALTEHGAVYAADPASFPQILTQLMASRTVRRRWQTHPRLAILGPVEARMQSADRLILGGFNEGNWPPRPEIDPWMNAEMRAAAGLQPHNWRTGLSAHDVWMAATTPEVIITRSLRDGDAVTTPSRWLQRLGAVLGALRIDQAVDGGQRWRDQLVALSPVPPMAPCARPRPLPPVASRPRRFSATEIDDWIADPYSLYAKRILGLRQLDEIDRPIDAALRGNLVHDTLAAFLGAYPRGDLPANALDELLAIARRQFDPFWQIPTVRYFWWPAFGAMASWFVETESRRRASLHHSHAEVRGAIEVEAPDGPVTFTARADRIDEFTAGGLAILDYKTGRAPAASEVAQGRRTQLITEAVIAAHGGFTGIAAADVLEMEYWRLTGKRDEPGSRNAVQPPDWDAGAARDSLARLAARFDDPAMPYSSRPDPQLGAAFPRYDHLARVDEWRIGETGPASAAAPSAVDDEPPAEPGFDPAVASEASAQQAAASDPESSALVSANAGTGKTKLLTDRVLRLMLEGALPDSILCVTYTRAAAAEMRNRISARLAKWAIAAGAALRADLAGMGITTPTQQMLARARSLFAETLDNDDGPRVETVHSFCQSVLRRFPIEAGIMPQAELADDFEQARLKSRARDNLLTASDTDLARHIGLLAEQTSEGNAETILKELLTKEDRIGQPTLLRQLEGHFTDTCGVDTSLDLDQMIEQVVAGLDEEGLRAAAIALEASGVDRQIRRGARITAWLGEAPDSRGRHVDRLIEALFTSGRPMAERSLSNAAIRQVFPGIVAVQQRVQDALVSVQAARAGLRCWQLTTALYQVGTAFQAEYARLKAQRGLLDYDDLITLTNNMLADGDAAQWVAWKLDNGIRHMLLDEAQDTSPAQWRLLRRLSDEFFEMAAGEDMPRTLFVVGDFKQSIYSFQGADPAVMGENRVDLRDRATAHRVPLREVGLDVSFRSARPVLDLVNLAVPALAGITDPRMPGFQAHRSARADAGGFVEIWPVISDDSEAPSAPAFAPPEISQPRDAAALSATRLAEQLAGWIGTRLLPSGRLMRAGDVMILLRKRGRYHRLVLAALQQAGIPVAGADRMKLEDQIEIRDLMALGDVMLLPEDDLQLAAVLKSPLFGIDEDSLFDLAYDRGGRSLHSRLMAHAGGANMIGRAADRLQHFRKLADDLSVFAFFSAVLTETRQEFRRRLGAAVDETLDHFLGLAQSFGAGGGVSLTSFLAELRGSGGEVRRDMDGAASNEVRVMTIHGAKGLEAPVVILPDMLEPAGIADQLVRDPESGFVYWAPGAARPDFVAAARDVARDRGREEENRLLYVALTRARDGIIIGGWQAPRRRRLEGSYYEHLQKQIESMPGVAAIEGGGFRVETAGRMEPAKTGLPTPPREEMTSEIPGWLFHEAPAEPRPLRPLRPSAPDGAATAASAPGTRFAAATTALARGRFAHRMFEVLPGLPAARHRAVIATMIAAQKELPAETAMALADDVMQVLGLPELAALFGPDSLAETSVSGVVAGLGVAGQIDRLHIDDERVLIGDFKTGPRPATTPDSYVRQMALYGAVMAQIYPQCEIVTWLIWTEVAAVEVITPAAREEALAALGGESMP